tara:strand:+ start:125 stop:289 length:165 start_codon:yes stop_codon:yes gene_type:complete
VVAQVEDKIQEMPLVVQVDQVEVVIIILVLLQVVQVTFLKQILIKVLMEEMEYI